MIKNIDIDNGKAFDWGRTSSDYARYRDIYPEEFYQKILNMGMCIKGQNILDIGTGTGVLPRNLYKYGAKFMGIDISENQIEQAIVLSQKFNMDIKFQCIAAEKAEFPDNIFDVITACQCFSYFNHKEIAPRLHKLLKPNGHFAILYMAWLPFEDVIAGKSEELVLKYNPVWTGCKEKRHFIDIPEIYSSYFIIENQDIFDMYVPFNRESWNGRIKSCRGIGASLSDEEIEKFDTEHRQLLEKIAPKDFEILHYVAMTTMKKI